VERLHQVEKEESLGRMAGAIAHHFNNMLGAVMGNLELALDYAPGNSHLRTHMSEAMKASRRAAEVSRLMLSYLGQTPARKKLIDLSDTVREAIPFLNPSLHEKLHLTTSVPQSGPVVRADEAHIRQILANLVSNAAEAILDEDGGDISLAIRVLPVEEIAGLKFFPRDWAPKPESYACLSVSDTGEGLKDTLPDKIFDPFFSTKFTGRGLGLAVVLGLVRAHDGAVVVDSRPGGGTLFRVFLPMGETGANSIRG
jgi:signal transduction histidine kinase